MQSLGFAISEKSVLEPVQVLPHLGFLLDSRNMTVNLGEEKRKHLIELLSFTLNKGKCKIRKLARIIGTLVASLPAVEYGKLYYRELELLKIRALKESRNYEKMVWLTESCREELRWWIQEGVYSGKVITHGNPDKIIETDASGFGYGGLLNLCRYNF